MHLLYLQESGLLQLFRCYSIIPFNQTMNSGLAASWPLKMILLSLSWICFASHVQAQYSNPVLRVFLFKTTAGVWISNKSGMTASNLDLLSRDQKKLIVKPYKPNSLIVNGRLFKSPSLLLKSTGKFTVQKQHSSSTRNYQGQIEIKLMNGVLHLINLVPVETYLEGVLNAEISTEWPMEVVKAQAVISRTYALYQRGKRLKKEWHLSADPISQAYHGAEISDERGRQAIRMTRGIIVNYKGDLAQTLYHSNCGGKTEDPSAIWNNAFAYLKVRSVPYGKSDPRFYWDLNLSESELVRVLQKSGIQTKQIKNISIEAYSNSGRVSLLKFVGDSQFRLKAKDFRRWIGYQRIQSLLFDIIRVPGGFYLKGQGNGHGVGLSQWSAKEMAEVGYDYQEILEFFYQNTSLTPFWG